LISANVIVRLGNDKSRPSRLVTNIGFVKPVFAKYSVVTWFPFKRVITDSQLKINIKEYISIPKKRRKKILYFGNIFRFNLLIKSWVPDCVG